MSCCGKIIKGTVGLAKAGLQLAGLPVDDVSADLLLTRRNTCRACDRATRNPDPRYAKAKGLTSLSRCTACSCVIVAKTRLASERCPLGKW